MSNPDFILHSGHDRSELLEARNNVVEYMRSKHSHLIAIKLLTTHGYYFYKKGYGDVEFEPEEVKAIKTYFTFRDRYMYQGYTYGMYSRTQLHPCSAMIAIYKANLQQEIYEAIRQDSARKFRKKHDRKTRISNDIIGSRKVEAILDKHEEIQFFCTLGQDVKPRAIHISYELIIARQRIYIQKNNGEYIVITPEDVDEEEGLIIYPSIFFST